LKNALPSSHDDDDEVPGKAGAVNDTNSPIMNVNADTRRHTSAPPSGRK